MAETIEQRLREALAGMPPEDVYAVAAFADFLRHRRRTWGGGLKRLSEEEHARIVAALDEVAALSMEHGPPVSNRQHDQYLYGGH